MPCILRDHCFVLVFVASLCNGIEAASHTSRDAHTVMVPELPVELASVSDGNHTLAQSEDLAAAIASTWGLSSSFALAQLAKPATSLEEALTSLHAYASVLVVLPGTKPPVRPDQEAAVPFLTLAEDAASQEALGALPLASINQAAATASSLMGLTLYPLRLEAKTFNSTSSQGPWVLYDASAGVVCMDARMLNGMHELPVNMVDYTIKFASQLFTGLTDSPSAIVQQAANTTALGQIFSATAAATAMALTSQVPLWYCFSCPIVLGLLFPFLFNFGLGEVAEKLCEYYSLPTEQCNELWYGAFALAMILSFASVLPIISICKLAQCAKPSSPSLS